MNFESLHEFIILCEEKSYTEATEKLNISESTLSRHIIQLEQELGVKLFERTSRKVKINEYGTLFLDYARQLIEIQQKSIEEINYRKFSSKNTINIVNYYFIDDFLSALTLHDNSISFNLLTENLIDNAEVIKALKKGKCDIAFLHNLSEAEDDIESLEFAHDSFVAVLPKSHPLADRNKINVFELKNDNFISFPQNVYGASQINRICRKSGFEPKIVLSAHVGSAIIPFIEKGIGVSILMKKSIEKNLRKTYTENISLVELEPPESFTVRLCYSKKAALSPAAKKLVDFAKNEWSIMQS